MNLIDVIGQAIGFFASFAVVILIIPKRKAFIGNKLFIGAFSGLSFYCLIRFLYNIPISVGFNEFLIRFSLVVINIVVLLIVMTIQTFIRGSIYLKSLTNIVHMVISGIVILLTILFPYRVIEIEPEIRDQMNYGSLIPTLVFLVYLMSYNVAKITIILKDMDPGQTQLRKNLTTFRWGQIIAMLSPVMSLVGSVLDNDFLHSILYIALGVAAIFVFIAIRTPSTPKKDEIDNPTDIDEKVE